MDKIYDQREELHKIKAKTERVSRKSECAGSVAGCEHWDETEERSKNKMKTYEATDIWSSVEYGVGDEKNHQFVKYEDHLKVVENPQDQRVSDSSQFSCSVEISELSLLVNLWESKSKEEGLSDFDRGVARGLEIAAMGVKRKIKPNDTDEA